MQQAELRCKQRLKNDPENRAVLRSLAEVYRKLGNLEEAGATYNRLFHLDPQDREAGYMQAVLGGKEWPIAPTGIRAAPFVLVKGFLPRELHDALLPFFISACERFISVKLGRYAPDIRQTLEFPDEWPGRNRFKKYIADISPCVGSRLNLPLFTVVSYEIQVRAYQDGHFFKIHRDADPDSQSSRRMVNFVYFFHKLPRPYTGGELLLFDSEPEVKDTFTVSRFTRVVPEDNSIIFFPPHFYHSVVPIGCPSHEFADSRFVINGHFHRGVEVKTESNAPVETIRAAAPSIVNQ